MPNVNQKIGPYRLVKKLGQGGFGEVWLAEKQTKFVTKKLAVKLPLKDQVDAEAVRHEATLWEQASGHPNVLPIIDADEYEGQIVIVSEFAPDGSLADLLKTSGRLSVEKAVEMIDGILAGLEFLHSRKVIHRDLKPDNVLLQGETPRLADFGISRVLRTTMTSSSINLAGTPYYMAPEAFDKKRNEQTDIWAVGVIFYEILAGNRPFEDDNLINLVSSIATKEPESLPENVPNWLKEVTRKALAKTPAERYRTANEMRTHLRQLAKIPEQKQEPVILPNPKDNEAKTEPYDLSVLTLQSVKKDINYWRVGTVALSAILFSGIGGTIYYNRPNERTENNKNSNLQTQISQIANKEIVSTDTNRNPELLNPAENINSTNIKEIAKNFLKYDKVGPFSEELAFARINNKYGFIDKTGKEIIPLSYDDVESFSEGLARVIENGNYGFIDKTGKRVFLSKDYFRAESFSEGLAVIKSSEGNKNYLSLIDQNGKEKVSLKYNYAYPFSEGLAVVQKDKFGFIDKTGKEIIPLKFKYAEAFSEGVASVEYMNNKNVFIDKTGKEVIAPQREYDYVSSFSEGLAKVTLSGKNGFIDKTGTEIISLKYDSADSFLFGLAEVNLSGKKGFINKNNREVIAVKYDSIWCYAFVKEGFVGITLGEKKGFVDLKGNEYFDF